MKEKATIYDYGRLCRTVITCDNCPLCAKYNETNLSCDDLLIKNPDKANEIIINWCEEHPIKTKQDKFLEMFPNAKISSDGVIGIAPCAIEKNKHITSERSCPVAHGFNNCDECRKNYWIAEVAENE